jgi:hypothetical protein
MLRVFLDPSAGISITNLAFFCRDAIMADAVLVLRSILCFARVGFDFKIVIKLQKRIKVWSVVEQSVSCSEVETLYV